VASALRSLRDILEQDLTVDKFPECFCFALLERFELAEIDSMPRV
jgi:hypothetical protein